LRTIFNTNILFKTTDEKYYALIESKNQNKELINIYLDCYIAIKNLLSGKCLDITVMLSKYLNTHAERTGYLYPIPWIPILVLFDQN
jgi:hypothetical protein